MTSNMFSFISKTWNPIAGGPCPFACYRGGCWATMMKDQYNWDKYKGAWRIHASEINRKFKPGEFVFVCDMIDLGAPDIPSEVIESVLDSIGAQPDVMFLLLTKSDRFYGDYMHEIPYNCVCGITMETDLDISEELTRAPHPQKRLDDLLFAKVAWHNVKTFISIEPIMKFSDELAGKIEKAEPWAVAVGYDGYNNRLPEPTKDRTENLIRELEKLTTVFRKRIRRAWDEPVI